MIKECQIQLPTYYRRIIGFVTGYRSHKAECIELACQGWFFALIWFIPKGVELLEEDTFFSENRLQTCTVLRMRYPGSRCFFSSLYIGQQPGRNQPDQHGAEPDGA